MFREIKVFCKKGNSYEPVFVDKCPCCGSSKDKFSGSKCTSCGNIVVNMDGFYLIKMDLKKFMMHIVSCIINSFSDIHLICHLLHPAN